MIYRIKYVVGVLFALLLLTKNATGQSFNWQSASPEEEGFSSQKLNAMKDSLAKYNTSSIIVIRNDKIVLEWYAKGWDEHKQHGTASLAKALVGGMSLLLALNDGKMMPDDPAWKFVPQWKNDPLKSKITIRHLATHSSGIEDAEITDMEAADAKAKGIVIKDQHMDIPGWKGVFWRKDPDPFIVSRDQAPVMYPPGSANSYSNPGMAMLSYAIASSYRGMLSNNIRTLLKERIFKPIGINDNEWQIGYGKTYNIDGLELVPNWGGASFTPRAIARIGRLMLNKGNWEGKQLIDSNWVRRVVAYAGTPVSHSGPKEISPANGLGWYNNFFGVWPRAPRDLFLGSGAGHQTLMVIPSLNIIIVRNGTDMFDERKGEPYHAEYVKYIINPLMDALIEAPYPQSDRIREVRFAPVASITRKANDSDNWPVTWGDDDHLYAAYGDGSGFEPKVDHKLSLGLARITGNPPEVKGVNIRSKSGVQEGSGIAGKKASGLLMVKGVLYMWIRNAGVNGEGSQLAWSKDHGVTWSYSSWKFSEGFGCPTFLNFGKNYQGARDNYVYVYSQDAKDAYTASDRMVMARVEKDQITNLKAYSFFKGLDAKGNPVWTQEIADRGGVFVHPAMCYRSGISYDPGLKRYLWCQVHPDSNHPQGPRFQGGFGIYESVEPWGPWHTVYYTRDWDVGPGDTSSFPTKWMSRDGKSCWLLFSGEDSFSLRKAEFILR